MSDHIPLSEKEKMLAGELYDALDPELAADRHRCRQWLHRLNVTEYQVEGAYERICRELFPHVGERFWVEPPFYCDYGYNIHTGPGVYFNFNCVVLDLAPVSIGEQTMFGPAVQILTAGHPKDAAERSKGPEWGKAIAIGKQCWFGAAAIVCPGVTIGDRCVIGAGAVVTRDIPDDAVAVGNPARVR